MTDDEYRNDESMTKPDKKKAAAQNDEQPTDEGGRCLIPRKPAKNHHQTDGQMNNWKTNEQWCKRADDIVKYREQLKMLFFLLPVSSRDGNQDDD